MQERIKEEITLIQQWFPDAEYHEEGYWVRIPSYSLPEGWSQSSTEVVFQVPVGYPGTPPYGIYVSSGLQFQSGRPDNYTEPAGSQPSLVRGGSSLGHQQVDSGDQLPISGKDRIC